MVDADGDTFWDAADEEAHAADGWYDADDGSDHAYGVDWYGEGRRQALPAPYSGASKGVRKGGKKGGRGGMKGGWRSDSGGRGYGKGYAPNRPGIGYQPPQPPPPPPPPPPEPTHHPSQ